MPYKHGKSLIDNSLAFRLASTLTFYTVWPVAQFVNILFYSSSYENIGKLKGIPRAIVVSNHTTFLDPVMISRIFLPGRTWHTLLEATVETPVLGTLTRLLGGMPIPRGRSGFRQLAAECEKAFKHRRFIHFYPEGECYLYNQQVREFKPGAFLIAAELDIPVVPLATVFSEGRINRGNFWGRSLPRQKLVVLDPVYPAQFISRDDKGEIKMDSVHQFAGAVRDVIQTEIDSRSGTSAFYRGKMDRIKGIND
ncbi:lysophospholipid acyltransferase family protein [Breznakiella homolactica]|uniref:1-acyl-sn-glycerol-3-phosphate acyltransferase n=1 Tax=Breznakiella homolactica TaxID=2798577 RepID=A0A7T7XM48_9SPIR|nr:lysophospholipid acyltransferase family protein [Breznakiella homolactica]QQO08910.1 1-acyl-sn-glycerol-3-phosphate acyltransferase [Breznakiella homolactica]